jgi:hypothetical protein
LRNALQITSDLLIETRFEISDRKTDQIIMPNYICHVHKMSTREKKVSYKNVRFTNIHQQPNTIVLCKRKKKVHNFTITTANFMKIRATYWIFCEVMSLDSANLMKLARHVEDETEERGKRKRMRVMEVSREFVNSGKEKEK